jgi:hypothetical protein
MIVPHPIAFYPADLTLGFLCRGNSVGEAAAGLSRMPLLTRVSVSALSDQVTDQ